MSGVPILIPVLGFSDAWMRVVLRPPVRVKASRAMMIATWHRRFIMLSSR